MAEWLPPEEFSPEKRRRYIDNFRVRSIVHIIKNPAGLSLEELLAKTKPQFKKAEREKLYSERNLRVARYLLSRALKSLEQEEVLQYADSRYTIRKPAKV